MYPKSIKWVHVRDVMSTKIENRTYETDSIVSILFGKFFISKIYLFENGLGFEFVGKRERGYLVLRHRCVELTISY